MHRHLIRTSHRPAALVACTLAASLAACGGGADGTGASLDDSTATAYAANAVLMASNASDSADTAILTAQNVVGAGALAGLSSGDERVTALAVPAAAKTQACAGGGTATVSITGGTPASQLNGKLDAGEVYGVVFAACKGALGAAALDGALSMNVVAASGDASNGSISVTFTATQLKLTTARGSATLDGTASRDLSVSTDSDGVIHVAGHYTSPGLTLATNFNNRSSTFTVSALDIQRTATLVGGVLQSSSISGTHTLSATLPNGSFSFTVATTGSASYAADGSPVAGSWTVTLPDTIVGVSVAVGTATITIDRGKDGTIDRTITITVPQLASAAG